MQRIGGIVVEGAGNAAGGTTKIRREDGGLAGLALNFIKIVFWQASEGLNRADARAGCGCSVIGLSNMLASIAICNLF